jgi:general stress protein 26
MKGFAMQGSASSKEFAKLKELIDEIKIGMLTTEDTDGTLRSRPLQTRTVDNDGSLWFFTSRTSPKVAEASADGWRVNVSYSHPGKMDYVSISGRATLVDDRERMKALWTKWVEVFFPKGLNDPDLALLRVDIEKAEYWDSPGTAVGRAYAVAKALATGDTDATGDNVKLQR